MRVTHSRFLLQYFLITVRVPYAYPLFLTFPFFTDARVSSLPKFTYARNVLRHT